MRRWSGPIGWAALLLLASGLPAPARAAPGPHFEVSRTLQSVDGAPIAYTNGFLLVPENRRVRTSRLIAVRYLRFAAQDGRLDREPVVMLPGGPGTLVAEDMLRARPDFIRTIRHVTKTRDFIILQQRGIRDGAYSPSLSYDLSPLPADAVADASTSRMRLRTAIADAQAHWRARGVDLAGYDIFQLTADIEALRIALGHRKIILYGTSFGSQWALAYLKLHQDRVARAVLTGVEPLDHTWDSPAAIWRTFGRLRPEVQDLYRAAIARLEAETPRVAIADPDSGAQIFVRLCADDLRRVRYPASGSMRQSMEAWPRFLRDISQGDFRYLASLALRDRRATNVALIGPLIDGGLDISRRRQAILAGEAEARRWLGEINAEYVDVRGMLPVADVGDRFRSDFQIDVPLLMIQGDADLSTPMDNAAEQLPFARAGRLVIVKGGTHQVQWEILNDAIAGEAAVAGRAMLDFLSGGDARRLDRLPAQVSLRPFAFVPFDGPGLYDRRTTR